MLLSAKYGCSPEKELNSPKTKIRRGSCKRQEFPARHWRAWLFRGFTQIAAFRDLSRPNRVKLKIDLEDIFTSDLRFYFFLFFCSDLARTYTGTMVCNDALSDQKLLTRKSYVGWCKKRAWWCNITCESV